MSEKKTYSTFMNIVEGKNTKDDGTFHFAVIRGSVGRIEKRTIKAGTPNEQTIVTASMPVNGKSKLINNILGTNYGEEDTIWVNLTFWNKSAERFIKFLDKSGNPDRIQMFVTGVLNINEYQKRDGSGTGRNVRLAVNDFNVISIPNNAATNSTSAGATATSVPAASSETTTAPSFSDDFDMDGFVGIDGSEDDLPF